ncbi:class I SAM-dependent methyltransferase [Jiangella rhizosphaerae]|uniref:Class I SAM-dependent methyltransferase n=1 Tax=Jiangella rhizosphaerae TaxID=2293569 RepID=A0A418KX70_9ACTN|nr:class I SAM-dependent methyltransferase [Jiangella rhizosphaerae]RIQ37414.1 class I SAM-dependent methyltransferase [Jiangella rhizosphaerae]
MREPWNANIHYDARLAACVPPGAGPVLDVGCGDGFLAARLAGGFAPADGGAAPARRVVALDADAPVLERARARFPDAAVDWRHGDVLTYPFQLGSFDAVVSNATLHHLPDAAAALRRLGALVRPGGVLAVVGFARFERRDLPWAAAAFVSLGVANRVRRKWEHSAPQHWPPPHTYRELGACARAVLPGVRLSRLLMGRYLLAWPAPGVASWV